MKTIKTSFLSIIGMISFILFYTGCDKENGNDKLIPVVSTYEVTEITQVTAVSGGDITSDGGATVTARGVCWSTNETPTNNDSKTEDGAGAGAFSSQVEGLIPEMTYYLRAYATNNQGTGYGMTMSFTTPGGTEGYNDVFNPATGKTWLDRNLGASRVAQTSADDQAYGDLYQWGRLTDGHEKRTSDTTSTLSNSNVPGHGNFITVDISSSPYDWHSLQNNNLWQGVSGTNNPCPAGYRLPNEAEWQAERQSWSSNDAAGAFNSPLKLPVGGIRTLTYGSLYIVGSGGYYWSASVDGAGAQHLYYSSSDTFIKSTYRAHGASVRCIKD